MAWRLTEDELQQLDEEIPTAEKLLAELDEILGDSDRRLSRQMHQLCLFNESRNSYAIKRGFEVIRSRFLC